jgi:hypothetical protein
MNDTTSYDAVIKALRMLKRVRRLDGSVLLHEGILLNADTLLTDRQCSDFVREVNALLSQYKNGSRPLSRALLGFDGGNVMIFNVLPFTLCLFFGKLEDSPVVERAGEEFLSQWSDSLRLEVGEGIELPSLDRTTREVADVVYEAVAVDLTEPVTVSEVVPAPAPVEVVRETIEVVAVSVPESAPVTVAVSSETVGTVIGGASTVSVNDPAADRLVWISFRQKTENLLSKVLGRAQATRLIERELAAIGLGPDGHLTASQLRPFGHVVVQKIKDKALRKQLESEMLAHVDDHLSGS